jgi:Concanavalin A-like lectin/glucanases superfamily
MEGFLGEEGYVYKSTEDPEELERNVWSHVALTFDGAHMRLYVDGELVDTTSANGAWATSGPLSIGCSAEFEDNFEGQIDEVRIYNRALSEAEIRGAMSAPLPMAKTEGAIETGANDAILTGAIEANGPETEYSFEYGPSLTYGEEVTGEELQREPETLEIEQAIIDLEPETKYHFRIVADSPSGISYGKDRTFLTDERTITQSEEQEIRKAELDSTLTPKAEEAGPGDFYGMMWTGNLPGMLSNKSYQVTEDSGASWIKLPLGFNFPDTQVEDALKEAEAHNLNVLLGMGGNAFPRPATPLRTKWLEYAAHAVEKFGPNSSYKLRTWEIWNEPNMPHKIKFKDDESEEQREDTTKLKAESIEEVNPKAFADFFKEMAVVMRAAAEKGEDKKGIKILAPGLFGYRSPKAAPDRHQVPRKFLRLMNAELGGPKTNVYDALSLHPYVFRVGKRHKQHRPEKDDMVALTKAINRSIVELHKLRENKPIWVTELGFPVSNPENKGNVPPVSHEVQKAAINASFSMMQSNRDLLNIAHAFYYNLQDMEEPGWEYHSGLLKVNGEKRPAWTAYKCLAKGEPCS